MSTQLPATGTLRSGNRSHRQHQISHRNPKTKQSKLSITSKSSKPQGVEKQRKTNIRKFTYFNKLPVEIRFSIYRYSSLHERIIRAEWSSKAIKSTTSPYTYYSSVFTLSAGPVPTVLHINCETRKEALRYYMQTQKYITYRGPAWRREEKIWISMQDMIYFTTIPPKYDFRSALSMINKGYTLTHLSFGVEHMSKFLSESQKGGPNFFRELVRSLPNIKKFTVVFDASRFKDSKDTEKYRFGPVSSTTVHNQRASTVMGTLGLNGVRLIQTESIKDTYYKRAWGDTAVEGWVREANKKAWRVFLEKNPEWVVPELECVKISKQR